MRPRRQSADLLRALLVLPWLGFQWQACGSADDATPVLVLLREQRPLMGTLFTVQVMHPDEPEAREAARHAVNKAFERANAVEQAASDYLDDSELTRLNNTPSGVSFELGDDLRRMLSESLRFARLSEGAFDPTVGRLSLLWRRSRRSTSEPPTPEQLRAALVSTGWRHLRLIDDGTSVVVGKEGLRLDLGGIGKGFAADRMLDVLADAGFPQAVVSAAGDIRAGDPPAGSAGWMIRLSPFGEHGSDLQEPAGFSEIARAGSAEPFQRDAALTNQAVSTSGDRHQFLEYEGGRFSHIIDPRTGRGLTHAQAVIVMAPTATEADALATALNVLGPEIPAGLRTYLEERGCSVWWFEPVLP